MFKNTSLQAMCHLLCTGLPSGQHGYKDNYCT